MLRGRTGLVSEKGAAQLGFPELTRAHEILVVLSQDGSEDLPTASFVRCGFEKWVDGFPRTEVDGAKDRGACGW